MLDARIELPKEFCQALLARLDRLLALLEYHVGPTDPPIPRGPGLPPDRAYFEVNDQTLFEMQMAEERFQARWGKGRKPDLAALQSEIADMRKDGLL